MATRSASTAPAPEVDDKLIAPLAARLGEAPLAGDAEFAPDALTAAARFVLATARERAPGAAAVAVESVGGPLGGRMTRIAAINADQPFLVDSIAAAVGGLGLTIDRLAHPIVAVRRDAHGRLTALPDDIGAGLPHESFVYIETERVDARTRMRLRKAIDAALGEVHAATADWPQLRAALAADATRVAGRDAGRRDEADEAAALLRWLADDRLTQLGHVRRARGGGESDTLGVCRAGETPLLSERSYARAFAWFEDAGAGARALLIVKSNRISKVHRPVPLDLFLVPVFAGASLVALSVHAGIWTSGALAATPADVPILRRRLAEIMARYDFDPGSHTGKALVHALTALPHDVVVGLPAPELERIATTMIGLIDRPRAHLVLARAPLDRHLYAFVWLPRDALSTERRREIEAMIAATARAPVLDWSLAVDGALATIRITLDLREDARPIDEAALVSRLRTLVRGWPEALEAALAEGGRAPGRAAAIAGRFAEAFPRDYRNRYDATEAAADVERLLALSSGDSTARTARLHCLGGCPNGQLRLKLYQHQGTLALSDAVPMLENFGFRVDDETPTLLNGGALGSIHDFLLELPPGQSAQTLLARAAAIEPAVAAVLNASAENDAFNRMITNVGLAAREADWLRALYRYLRQAGMTYTTGTVVAAFEAAPRVTRGLIDGFVARHDPAHAGDREANRAAAAEAVRAGLAQVSAINDDRLLRRYQALIDAIVRTNAFVPPSDETAETALAFKFDSTRVPGLPRPVPWREIFVCSRRVEGIHLRAGPVARGGLRWSDRRDDFRTEVLGLMKAQRVKNAVIVPTGAKGGFYPRNLPDPARDREGWLKEGEAAYRVFVRSLLSLTDNIVGGKVVHPSHMVIAEGDDPYFVVAADKGTASFSDVANAIAAERDFWLDDAFASGGSKGYDHKAMGITARGAWLSVQRHFSERGVDVQRDRVRVVGCGDMSGDVFGNGMLLSRTLKLVAAFDHRHVFIDPDPDPEVSFVERQRLFALPRSSWDDYDKALLSPGGGVYPRTAKAIALSAEAGAALGIATDIEANVDPDTLIRAILTSRVDLLWFGGIGTYVKASSESHAAVGDPANDALRVDAGEVRAAVIGEGANLGCTQAGRIEFALAGGKLNTDFIDNSAGVDCSDNEVNIKIALASAKHAGRLDEDGRVALLGAMTDDVAALVLEDNRLQALALSIAEAGGPDATPAYLRLIETLADGGQIDRSTDGLADGDTLMRRAREGTGLTRPELAVVLSSAKLSLQAGLETPDLHTDSLHADPLLEQTLIEAFPTAMREAYRGDILAHRLRREIGATKLANRIVNCMGLVHPFELAEEEGATAGQFGAAFVAAEQLFRMPPLWAAIERAAMPEPARLALFDRAAAALRPHIADLLRAGAGRIAPSRLVAELGEGTAKIAAVAAEALGQEARAQSLVLRDELAALGAPLDEAALVADLYDLDGAVGIARLAHDTGGDPVALARAFVVAGSRLGLDWAQGKAARMNPKDPWERLLVGGLARDFQAMRLDFLARLVGRDGGDPANAVARWADTHASVIDRFHTVVRRAQAAVAVTPAMLAQIAAQARGALAT